MGYNKTMKNTIKARKDFDFEDSKSIAMPSFFVKFRRRHYYRGEYGLVASKRSFLHAVERNRAKRQLRAWLSKCKVPARFDLLLIARPMIMETTLTDGVGQMKKAIKKIKAIRRGQKANPDIQKDACDLNTAE